MADGYQQIIDSYTAQQKKQEDYLRQQYQNEAKQLQGQLNQTVGKLNNIKNDYRKAYDENARQAYVQKMQAQRDLPQQLAAQGVSGGLSESGNIALNAAYGNQLSGYKGNYDSQVEGVNQNLSEAQSQYDSQMAGLGNTLLGKIAENQNYYGQLIEQQKAARIQAQEQERLARIQAEKEAEIARIQAEQQAKAEAEAKARAARSGGASGTASSNNGYLNQAQSLLKQDLQNGGRTAYDYLTNLLSGGYINGESFSNIAAQIGLTEPMLQRYITSDDIIATARAVPQVVAQTSRPAAPKKTAANNAVSQVTDMASRIASMFK